MADEAIREIGSPRTSEPGGTASKVASLEEAMEELIRDINAKRKEDEGILTEYKNSVNQQAQKQIATIENIMYDVYNVTSASTQEKITELYHTIERIRTLEAELTEFKLSLQALYDDIHK